MQSLKNILTNGLIVLGLSFGLTVSASASNNLNITMVAAEQGDAVAQTALGSRYLTGNGVRQDYTKAFYWNQKAANQGFVYGQYMVGSLYKLGQGVRQSNRQAKEWFGKSCDNGYQNGCDEYRKLNEQGY